MSLNEIIPLPSLQQKLRDAGYDNLEEIKRESVYNLTRKLQLNREEVKILIKISDKETKLKRTFAELLTAEKKYSISTASKNFDKLLGDGIPPFKITEICGESGSGKTQLCMQLAINVQLSQSEGGVHGECIYIDTEGSFQSSRIVSMASNKYDIENILKGIHLFRVHNHAELIALIRQLPDILKEYPNIRLIIIDSIAYHFRLNTLDSRTRISILDYIAQSLIEIAHIHTLAVVASNHVTTDGTDITWTPSLGSSWGYWCAKRLFLFRKREFRYGYLYKSVENAGSQPAQFCIKSEGIVDPEEDEVEIPKLENKIQEELNDKIESTWEEMKNIEIKQEDDFWNEDILSQIADKTEAISNNNKNLALTKPSAQEKTTEEKELMSSSSQLAISSISSLSSEENISDTSVHDINQYKVPKNTVNVNEKRLCDISDSDSAVLKKIKTTNDTHNMNLVDDHHNESTANDNQSQQELLSVELTPTSSYKKLKENFAKDCQSDSEEELDLDFIMNAESYF